MASSKARSRNRSGGARSGGARPAARTAAAKPQAQAAKGTSAAAKSQGAKQQTVSAPSAQPVAPAIPAGPPPWLQWLTFGLAILGLADSAYETYAHYTGSQLAGCPTGGHGTFDCAAVITSSQSMVFNVFPVAVLGLAFYVFVVAIMSPWAWRMQRREVGLLRLVAMITGMGFVMYLIYAEVVQIQQICEYCTGVHIITFVLFCITVFSAAIWGLGKSAPKAKAA